MLATYVDANRYLDQEKVKFFNNDDANDDRIIAETHVRSLLSDIYGDDIVGSWSDANPLLVGETQVPELITEIVAMLMAASKYIKAYSLEANTSSNYGLVLQKRADDTINKLRTRELTLIDLTILTSGALTEDDFWPNDTDVWPYKTGSDGLPMSERAFSMDLEF